LQSMKMDFMGCPVPWPFADIVIRHELLTMEGGKCRANSGIK
jgi:hypothetical protein